MVKGRILYQGPVNQLTTYFRSFNYICPSNYNPADFIMFLSKKTSLRELEEKGVVMSTPPEGLMAEIDGWSRSSRREGGELSSSKSNNSSSGSGRGGSVSSVSSVSSVIGNSSSKWAGWSLESISLKLKGDYNIINTTTHSNTTHTTNTTTITTTTEKGCQSSFSKQFSLLTIRELQRIKRDKMALIGRFGVTIFLNLLFGLIFYQSANQDDSDPSNFSSHIGAVTMVLISSMFGAAQPVMLQFPFERPIFLRENSTGTCKQIDR